MSLTISNETEWNEASSIYTLENRFVGNLTITAPFSFTNSFNPIYVGHGSVINGQNNIINMGNFCSGLFCLPNDGANDTVVTNVAMDGNEINTLSILGFLLHYCEASTRQTGAISNIRVLNRRRY